MTKADFKELQKIKEQLSSIDDKLITLWLKANNTQRKDIKSARDYLSHAYADITWVITMGVIDESG